MSLAIVPGAGTAERFGSTKLLADVHGVPLVARTIRSLQDGGIDRVVLVVAPGSPLLDLTGPRNLFRSPAVQIAINPDPERGMLSSIQAGLAAADSDRTLMLPADMPFVRPATVAAVLAAAAESSAIILPTYERAHGHPIGLPAAARDVILGADPRATLKDVLAASGLDYREVLVDDPGVLRDVDVPRDLHREE